MTNALLGIVAIALLWFALPLLVTLGAVTCCLVAHALPGRRRARRRPGHVAAADVHQIPAARPDVVQLEVAAGQCTARVA